jgi:hypothetical protein
MDRHRAKDGKNLRSSEMGPAVGSCEYSNTPSGFINVEGFLDKLGNYLFSQKPLPSRPYKPRKHVVGEYSKQSIPQPDEQVGCGSVCKNPYPCRNL